MKRILILLLTILAVLFIVSDVSRGGNLKQTGIYSTSGPVLIIDKASGPVASLFYKSESWQMAQARIEELENKVSVLEKQLISYEKQYEELLARFGHIEREFASKSNVLTVLTASNVDLHEIWPVKQ